MHKTMNEKDAAHARRVGNTILQQLRMDGPLGMLACIAAREFAILPLGEEYQQGGLCFRSSIHRPATKHLIYVWLTWLDTYHVEIRRRKRGRNQTVETLAAYDDVYCDQLSDLVETLAEEHA